MDVNERRNGDPEVARSQSQSSGVSEHEPLLGTAAASTGTGTQAGSTPGIFDEPMTTPRATIWGGLVVLFIVGLVCMTVFEEKLAGLPWFSRWVDGLPRDPDLAAVRVLESSPVIDGHIDLPEVARRVYANNVSAIDLESRMPYHVDIPRLRKGMVGGFFWSVFVGCPQEWDDEEYFTEASWLVRDTLEQVDIARLLIAKYPSTFQLATTAAEIREAVDAGKIASLLGIEGGHSLGNSIAALRQFHALGVRYLTLTHTCHNAFADSAGLLNPIKPLHGGLSHFGYRLIDEMNRLGVLIDLSHTSDATAGQALLYSKAPVMWSHSSAKGVYDVPRNVPDHLLKFLGTTEGKKDGIVMVTFYPAFIASGTARLVDVVEHIEHIARVAGKEHVGIGSDFDGMNDVPVGLEDTSKYPALIAELYRRGWTKRHLQGLAGGNLLRVMQGAEKVAADLQNAHTPPVVDVYKRRTDLPMDEL